MRRDPIYLQACLNGDRSPGWRARLPTTPADLAAEALAAMEAGASSLHIHPRGGDGRESLRPVDVARAIGAIRAVLPGMPIGVSTGGWIVPDVSAREAAIRSWVEPLPDVASVNFREPGAATVMRILREKGVAVEAGLQGVGDVRTLAETGDVDACLRVLIEPPEDTAGPARRNADGMVHALDELCGPTRRLLHGHSAAAWPMLEYAARLGYETRIGLDDVGEFPDGHRAEANADLVAVAVARYLGRGGREA